MDMDMDNGQLENWKPLLEADENDGGENSQQWWVTTKLKFQFQERKMNIRNKMRKNKNQERKMKIRKKMKGNQEENRKDKKKWKSGEQIQEKKENNKEKEKQGK